MELVFDGQCGFCQRSAEWARRHYRGELRTVANADVSDEVLQHRGITRVQLESAVWLFAQFEEWSGSAAVAKILQRSKRPWRWLGFTLALPGIRRVARIVYWVVARERGRLPGSTCQVPASRPQG